MQILQTESCTIEIIKSLISNKLDKFSNKNLSENIFQFEIYNQICTHEFFSQLISNQLDLKTFLQAQKPFFWAVHAWGNLMSSVESIESDEQIKQIYRANYMDEIGDQNTEPHTKTFINYLYILGFPTTNTHNDIKVPEPINIFLNYLNEVYNSDSNTRLLAFGTIEFIYIYISLIIHNYVSKKIGKKLEHHYTMHALMDIDHSLNFLNKVSKFDCEIISKTINVFLNLYLELFKLSQS